MILRRHGQRQEAHLTEEERHFFKAALEQRQVKLKDVGNYLLAKQDGLELEQYLVRKGMHSAKVQEILETARNKMADLETKTLLNLTPRVPTKTIESQRKIPVRAPLPQKPAQIPNTYEENKVSADDLSNLLNNLAEQRKGRYSDVKELGRGGMGAVYYANDKKLGRPVALKVALANNQGVKLRFQREAVNTAGLDHPNIINVYDLGEFFNKPYYAMKFVQGGKDLSNVLQEVKKGKSEYTTKDLLRMMIDVCDAMDYSHEKGIIHRDLKPANIMVDTRGRVYVADWGLAKKVRTKDGKLIESDPMMEDCIVPDIDDSADIRFSTVQLTRHGAILGSPQYMSPEQADPRTAPIDEKSDIYSLGAILYEILSGERLRQANQLTRLLLDAAKNEFEPIKKIAKIPAPLASIAYKALATEQQERYETAGEMGKDIKRYLDDERVQAHNYSFLEIAQKTLSKHAGKIVSAGAIAIASAIGLAAYENASKKAEQNEKIAIQSQKDASDAKAQEAEAKAALSDRIQAELDKSILQNKANEKLWLAEKALKRRDLTKAIQHAEEALQIYPESIEAHFIKGQANYHGFNAEQAITEFMETNKLSLEKISQPDYRSIYSALMTNIDLKDDVNSAVELAKQYRGSSGNDSHLLLIKSIAAYGEKQYAEAMQHVQEVIHQDSRNAEALNLRAYYQMFGINNVFNKPGLRQFQNHDQALRDAEKALSIDPTNIRYIFQCARLNSMLKNSERAIMLSEPLIEQFPNVPGFYVWKAQSLIAQGRNQESIDLINNAERNSAMDDMTYTVRGLAYLNTNQLQLALHDFDKSLQLKKTAPAYTYRGRVHTKLGNLETAIQDETKAIDLEPEIMPDPYIYRGLAYETMKKFDESLADYEKGAQMGHAEGNYLAGRMCYILYKTRNDTNMKNKAIEYLQKHLESESTFEKERTRLILQDLQK